MNTDIDPKSYWTAKLQGFLPGLFKEHPVLLRFHQRASVLFHGSITMGIDDQGADLDLWFLLEEPDLAKLDAICETRFSQITVDGKEGHLTAESVEDFSERLARCDMDLICQLRNAQIMSDNTGAATKLVELARKPMPQQVRDAFFFYHYVEMRGEHRACDNPIERGNHTALLLGVAKTITHALQAGIVLDGQPYPYDKWLHRAAMETPTGREVGQAVDRIFELLGSDALRLQMPQNEHPITKELMTIRKLLIDAAHARGIEGEWLGSWWLHMNQAHDAIKDVRWHD